MTSSEINSSEEMFFNNLENQVKRILYGKRAGSEIESCQSDCKGKGCDCKKRKHTRYEILRRDLKVI